MLLVTHDLDECFELGEEMLVLHHGKIVQSGAPREILDQPANLDVARILGTFNVLEAEIKTLDPGRNSSRLQVGEFELEGPYFPGHLKGDRVRVCIRPEQLTVSARAGKLERNQMPGELLRTVETPRGMRLEFSNGIAVALPHTAYSPVARQPGLGDPLPPRFAARECTHHSGGSGDRMNTCRKTRLLEARSPAGRAAADVKRAAHLTCGRVERILTKRCGGKGFDPHDLRGKRDCRGFGSLTSLAPFGNIAAQLQEWVKSQPEAPEGDWYKDFILLRYTAPGELPRRCTAKTKTPRR